MCSLQLNWFYSITRVTLTKPNDYYFIPEYFIPEYPFVIFSYLYTTPQAFSFKPDRVKIKDMYMCICTKDHGNHEYHNIPEQVLVHGMTWLSIPGAVHSSTLHLRYRLLTPVPQVTVHLLNGPHSSGPRL